MRKLQDTDLTQRRLTPRLDADIAKIRQEEKAQRSGYSRFSNSLTEAVDELQLAASVGAGSAWLTMCRQEIARHERIKDAAIMLLLQTFAMAGCLRHPESFDDDPNCRSCVAIRYANDALGKETTDNYLEMAGAVRQLTYPATEN